MDASSSQPLTFYDFLDRMRNPASLDLVRSIKSPENDGKRLQDFLLTMEDSIRDHPLWVGATEEEIDSAIEGLEKYVMTKLFSRTFAASPEDAKADQEISEKISLLQNFLRPEHLDIPAVLQNEASWLLAEKELQKVNAFKAPREKLLCILNCCRVINNLLLNAAMSENHILAGADDFLPVLIYVTIKANPPQLHSNLKFIQLYRRQEKLVSEVAYYFTNLVSAKSFIVDLDAKSLSMDAVEFQESMEAAREAHKAAGVKPSPSLDRTATLAGQMDPGPSRRMWFRETDTRGISVNHLMMAGTSNYPFMEAEAGELTVGDVETLLSLYKDVVTKYTNLCRAVKRLSMSKTETPVLVPLSEGTHTSPPQPEGRTTNVNDKRGE
ncbi:vacuolar protein sorting-associated protein 9A isoform X3 [Vitis vinifera]|uniref:vacuolar protein sorting-associated protein 9A isoform X3 n=1 Tax=Vitis vinifera TaxID=29760 RepID=UPI00053F6CBD|nr:vacuolar protein sorting-associated protein 9A isoform X3 [Vitis vinifera]|eukprot:XP_010665496.1 PREDICTED: vacuolar protein sorting-associated protein 9A isoform X3 [Vitis vinifera]